MEATALDQALWCMVFTFHKYTKKGENLLSKKQLKHLIKEELTIGSKLPEKQITALMKDLDQNEDQKIDFPEFSSFLGALAMSYNETFVKADPHCDSSSEEGGAPAGHGH